MSSSVTSSSNRTTNRIIHTIRLTSRPKARKLLPRSLMLRKFLPPKLLPPKLLPPKLSAQAMRPRILITASVLTSRRAMPRLTHNPRNIRLNIPTRSGRHSRKRPRNPTAN